MIEPEKFWMVYSPTGTSPPRRKHGSLAEATRVAEEMAERHPTQEFYVMEAMRLSKRITVTTIDLKVDIPF